MTTYREREAASAVSLPVAPGPAPEPVVAKAEDPDEALRRHFGARLVDAARAMLARGLVVTVDGDAVLLPTCTVRFLVGDAPEYARCDCAAVGRCEHIAIASWARRTAPSGTFELGQDARPVAFAIERPFCSISKGSPLGSSTRA